MRIGIDARIIAYRRGGIANYIRHLLPALAALDPDTDYRVLRHRKDRTRSEAAPNVRRATVWTPCHHRLERWALGVEIAPLRLDLLHSPDFIPPAFGARHFVITVHDLNFPVLPPVPHGREPPVLQRPDCLGRRERRPHPGCLGSNPHGPHPPAGSSAGESDHGIRGRVAHISPPTPR
jgi:hypothetical protein